jgi:H+/Cl- antiporter ClcA
MKDIIFDSKVNNPSNFLVTYIEFLCFSVIGLCFGLAIDLAFSWIDKKIKSKSKWKRIGLVYLQISVGAIVLSLLAYTTRHLKWEEHWQATTPGMAFSAFFFGIQLNIYSTLHDLFVP